MSLKAILWVMESAPVENHTELAILYAIADRAQDDGLNAWPSQDWLAARARCSVRTVRRHLRNLEDRGVIERGDERIVSHVSADRRPIVWNLIFSSSDVSERPDKMTDRSTVTDRSTGAQRPDNRGRTTGQMVQNDRTQLCPTNRPKPSLNHPEPSKAQNEFGHWFDRFWSSYPRKTGKGKAKQRFTEQIGEGASPESLVLASERFAEAMSETERIYIPHPSTFLNQGRWRDYLNAPKRASVPPVEDDLEAMRGRSSREILGVPDGF